MGLITLIISNLIDRIRSSRGGGGGGGYRGGRSSGGRSSSGRSSSGRSTKAPKSDEQVAEESAEKAMIGGKIWGGGSSASGAQRQRILGSLLED